MKPIRKEILCNFCNSLKNSWAYNDYAICDSCANIQAGELNKMRQDHGNEKMIQFLISKIETALGASKTQEKLTEELDILTKKLADARKRKSKKEQSLIFANVRIEKERKKLHEKKNEIELKLKILSDELANSNIDYDIIIREIGEYENQILSLKIAKQKISSKE